MARRPLKNFYRARTNATHIRGRERPYETLGGAEGWLDRHEAGGIVWHWENGEWVVVLDLQRDHPASAIRKSGADWVIHDALAAVAGVDDEESP